MYWEIGIFVLCAGVLGLAWYLEVRRENRINEEFLLSEDEISSDFIKKFYSHAEENLFEEEHLHDEP